LIKFSATVDGTEVLNRAFNRVEQHISDFRSIWPSVAGEVYAINAEQFESQGAAGASGRWAALSPAYARFKAVAFPGQPILQAEGHMVASLTDPNAADAIYRPLQDELIIGTKDPKATAHHRGLGNLPARPIFSFTEQQKRRIQKAIQRELVEFTRRAGFEVQEERAA
jgi:phage gpG-like protein